MTEPLRAPTASRGRTPDHVRYRPHLDGLRAVAVYLVVAFHSGLSHFRGGFVGVDVFFVLSGFLVTSILMRDLESHGAIQWRRFYSRRVRRILPAAVVVLVVTAFVYAAVATPLEVLDAVGGFRASFFYVANWYFFHQSTNYFAANVDSSPVLHFWSLAVEEQFYLLWPLIFGALYALGRRAGRRSWAVVRVAVVAMALASATEALHIGASNLNRAYYGTDTRAYAVTASSIHRLAASGRKIVLFEPTPLAAPSADPLSCLSTGNAPLRCGYEANRVATPFELALRARATKPDVWSVDLDRLVCPRLPQCDAVVDDIIVKRDWSHVTATYSRTLALPLFAVLHRQHIL